MVKDKTNLLNKVVHWLCEGLKIRVKILDIRNVFGRTDYLIEPESGEGSKWVSEERIHFKEAS